MENILEEPYTLQEMKGKMDGDGYVTGKVAVPFSDIIDSDFEGFLDMLARKLAGSECLMDINYKPVCMENTESGNADIIIEVSGNVSEIIGG